MDTNEEWPGSLIVGTHDEVRLFVSGLQQHGLVLNDKQLAELITQVFCAFLNGNKPLSMLGFALPNFDTLHHADEYSETQKQVIRHHFAILTRQLLDKTLSLGAWTTEANFPYAFDHFLGHDAVLFHLPY